LFETFHISKKGKEVPHCRQKKAAPSTGEGREGETFLGQLVVGSTKGLRGCRKTDWAPIKKEKTKLRLRNG